MSKENNLTDFLTDVADAIREKKGTTDKINPQDFSEEIKSIKTSTSMWTGHADVEGLKAIGWDDEDIAYYQEHGVNWMEEDDEYHKVSDDNKALYGVLTADNIQEYKDRIVYLPKIDTSKKSSAVKMFSNCCLMAGIPLIDLSKSDSISGIFENCYSLVSVPPIKVCDRVSINSAFSYCYSLKSILISFDDVTALSYAFSGCVSLKTMPKINNITGTNFTSIMAACYTLMETPVLNVNSVTNFSSAFSNCYILREINFRNIKKSISFSSCRILTKESILFIINNEAADEEIIFTLLSSVYDRLATDPDILEALSNHPNVSLASA